MRGRRRIAERWHYVGGAANGGVCRPRYAMPSTRSSRAARAPLRLTEDPDDNKCRGYGDGIYADYRVTGNQRRRAGHGSVGAA